MARNIPGLLLISYRIFCVHTPQINCYRSEIWGGIIHPLKKVNKYILNNTISHLSRYNCILMLSTNKNILDFVLSTSSFALYLRLKRSLLFLTILSSVKVTIISFSLLQELSSNHIYYRLCNKIAPRDTDADTCKIAKRALPLRHLLTPIVAIVMNNPEVKTTA